MTVTINPDRLAQLDAISLDEGKHHDFEDGHCAMEVVSWLADQGFTDAPACASPVLARYVIRLNDRWNTEKRQQLKPYLPRMVGTGGDGKDALREQIATRFLVERLLKPWLDLAGMTDQARLGDLVGASADDRRRVLGEIREAAWSLRTSRWTALRNEVEAKVRERLAEKPAAAVAAAAAAAVAVAVAAGVADAVAAAAAAAVADLSTGSDDWYKVRSAAYAAARKYYDEHPLPVSQQIANLAASQEPIALELLDALIDPEQVSA